MILALINEAKLPDSDIATFAKAVQISTTEFAKTWGLEQPIVQVGSTSPSDWKIYITNRARRPKAKGYHDLEHGVPVAYCSPQACLNKLYGAYTPPIISRGIFHKGQVLYAEKCKEGLITVIVHEVIEMLADPDPFGKSQLSEPDTQGRPWLVEPVDPVDGINYMLKLDGKETILPDFVYPSFYKKDGIAPFSRSGQAKAPFTIPVKTGYGFWRSVKGVFTKV